ncbi:GNAT family N-acetyltransferase [Hymenobacter sp. HSC-4F20]|uniref:GNAT family N-acetyltransferase n=1 Tax=Hymenobacter sp. HSC-4F20 TaxID=2864135 RepID=UPI001C72C534|nr:GNAT family N-acetyltransferase [Hymenobacter sp. HSC-4F20]MBX0291953.1 GNAT family N-acetyltransferase [Hymenobacter sp. HSC-4F20]
MNIELYSLAQEHWPEVRTIYEEGMSTGNATFQTEAPEWDTWNPAHLPHSRLVAVGDGRVLGWAALTPVSGRCVYAGVAEVSVYVAAAARGKGVGYKLLESLVAESEQNGIWTLQAGVFPENVPSIKLHESLGFRTVGYRERIGQMRGVWRNTVLLERRSQVVGSEPESQAIHEHA